MSHPFIANLETDLRAARAALRRAEADLADARVGRARAEERIASLESDLFRSDELRGAMVSSASLATKVTNEALKRLDVCEAIVDAAVDWYDGSVTNEELCDAIQPEVIRRRGAS